MSEGARGVEETARRCNSARWPVRCRCRRRAPRSPRTTSSPRRRRAATSPGTTASSTEAPLILPMVLLPMVLLPMVLRRTPRMLLTRKPSPSTARRTSGRRRGVGFWWGRTSWGRTSRRGISKAARVRRLVSRDRARLRGGNPPERRTRSIRTRAALRQTPFAARSSPPGSGSGARTGVWGARDRNASPAWTSSSRPPRPRSRPGWRTPKNNRSGGSTPNIVLRTPGIVVRRTHRVRRSPRRTRRTR